MLKKNSGFPFVGNSLLNNDTMTSHQNIKMEREKALGIAYGTQYLTNPQAWTGHIAD